MLGQQQWEARSPSGAREGTASRRPRVTWSLTARRCAVACSSRPGSRTRSAAASSLLDPHRAWLAECAPQVNHSARILWQAPRAQRGFTGRYVGKRGLSTALIIQA